MVSGGIDDEWVAFNQDHTSGFETELHTSSASCTQSDLGLRKRGTKNNNDDTSIATWMKKPINSDASWAPLAPPPTNFKNSDQHPVRALKKRPPKISKNESASRDDSNPVSSSSESSFSERQSRSSSRPRSSNKNDSKPLSVVVPNLSRSPKNESLSRRGRSRIRSPNGSIGMQRNPNSVVLRPPMAAVRRGRSMSQTRVSSRERSSSASHRSSQSTVPSDTKLRSRDRPPVTSPRLGNRLTETHGGHSRSSSRSRFARQRSVSRSRSKNLPPSTLRTRREMRNSGRAHTSVCGHSSDHRRPATHSYSNIDDSTTRSADPNIGRDISFGRTQSVITNKSSSDPTKKRSQIMERLFGDQVSNDAKQGYLPRSNSSTALNSISSQQPERIHSRILLTATVYNNTATNLWIATINTNQKGVAKNPTKASRYLKAFSFSTEKEARESAIANAPPKMMKFSENSCCFICKGKFAVFRRASHCRNCGVCICSACSTTWPAKALPETYNLKKESQVKVCKSCNYLSSAFKKALLEGDYEEAIAVYGSGNINLRTPFPQFSNKKEEVVYPIHCAVEGGNLSIVRWLMEDHFCPVKVIRTGGSVKKNKKAGCRDYPILTSKNRSVLTIAMDNLHVKVLRYLVVDCGFSIYETKDLKSSLRTLEAVLNELPTCLGEYRSDGFTHRWDDAVFDEGTSVASSLGADMTFPGSEYDESIINRTDADIALYVAIIRLIV
eukprot:CAMPEP_0197186784 /NCGR_PEP_ID=MMETSP1423-20130617/14612_1 /TAXON_ID=476441 /ORGANISM="Pseudo-nitzschia heimii, Strain UNC1101" /LENGTH=724 /DNA_ID=CAMNT_0042638191 /DNA_START=135 /DNA_END=2310 /DNA_ORIENTATION=+